MSRRFIVKIGVSKNTKYEIHVDDTESFDNFVAKLVQEHPIADDRRFKFVCKGKMITADNFVTLDSGSVLLAIICTTTPITEPSKIKENRVHLPSCKCTCDKQEQTSNPEPINQLLETTSVDSSLLKGEQEQTYSYDEVKGSMIVFLDFVRSNPQIKDLYQNDFAQLVSELINNPVLGKIMKDILGQSKHILKAIQTGGNISLKLGGDSDNSDNEIMLTQADGDVVNELISMGFDPNVAVVTYLKNNKDKAATIDALLSM